MGDKTDIEWTDATPNIFRGCSRTMAEGAETSGCGDPTGGGCYAERLGWRFAGPGMPYEGLVRMTPNGARWTGKVLVVDRHLLDPLRWEKPKKIFTTSVSDPFHERFTNESVALAFGMFAATPHHTHQFLTKRIKRGLEWFAWVEREAASANAGVGMTPAAFCFALLQKYVEINRNGAFTERDRKALARAAATAIEQPWPLPGVWIGVSVEHQAAADDRIPDLLATPAAKRWLSCEPLIGEIDLDLPRCDDPNHGPSEWGDNDCDDGTPWCGECDAERSYCHWLHLDGGIDWIVAGCESGPGARDCAVPWLRRLRDQCIEHEVAFFLKQARVGECISAGDGSRSHGVIGLPYLDGEQWAQFPNTEAAR